MELINASDLVQLLCINMDSGKQFDIATHCVDMMPRVNAVLVRHGMWIIRDNPVTGWYRVTCSECGEDVTSTAPCIGFFPNATVTWNYCPNCGSRMDGNYDAE